MGSTVAITRFYRLRSFARRRRRRRTRRPRVGFWRWRWFLRALTGPRRRAVAAWTARRCATGFIAIIAKALAGLRNRASTGAPSRLTPAQKQELARIVEAGPDRDAHGVVRWRWVDLRDDMKRRFSVELPERSVGRILNALGYRRLSVRSRRPKADEEMQETFKKTSPPSWPSDFQKRRATSRLKSGFNMKPASASKAR